MIRVGCAGYPIGRDRYWRSLSFVETDTGKGLPRLETMAAWRADIPVDGEAALQALRTITHGPEDRGFPVSARKFPKNRQALCGSFRESLEVHEAWMATRAATEALGAKIAIHYNRSRSEAQRLAEEVRDSFGREAGLFKADLANVRDVQRMAQAVVKQFKTVHVLVNNASLYEKTPFGETTLADWDSHLDVNLRAPFFLSQAIGPVMKEHGEGKILNVADWAGERPYADYIPYCVSKAGLLCLNTALAKALAPEVQVNAVLPGPVLLPENFSPKARKAVIEATLLKRLGSPEDVAQAVLFLLEGSDFITGAAVTVDGGRLIA